MRLICPNCDAHYEVDADLVPPSGRDVQCAECGHVWFQQGVQTLAIPVEPDARTAETAQHVEQVSRPESPEDAVSPEDDDPEDDDDDSEETGITPLAQRSLDDTLLAVLREEAEREARARARETQPPMESQPDLGLEQPPEPRRRIVVRARSEAPDTTAETTPALPADPEGDNDTTIRPSRRELLPDIEQINSTLRASGEMRRPGEASEEQLRLPTQRSTRRKGFRAGFLFMVVIFGLAALVYAQADRVSASVPVAAPTLAAYVAQVDAARAALDDWIAQALVKLNGS